MNLPQLIRVRIGMWALDSRNQLGKIESVEILDEGFVYRGFRIDGQQWATLNPRLVHPADGGLLDTFTDPR